MKKRYLLIIPLLSFMLAGCINPGSDQGGGEQEDIIKVKGISLSETSIEIIQEQSHLLTVNFNPSDATNKNVVWASNNSKIASVDKTGLVKGVSVGNTVIKALSEDGGYVASCSVSVISKEIPVVNVTGVALNKKSLTLKEGENETLIATISPSDADNQNVNWTSLNEAVATVSNSGYVSALKEGNATITVTTIDGGFTDTCSVTVEKVPEEEVVHVTSVSLNKTALTLEEGENETLTATVLPNDATNKNVSWSSSDTSIATVDQSGSVEALKEGSATIKVTTADGSFKANCTLTVTKKEEPVTVSARMQDTAILHCWNWSMNNISNQLQTIKDAGFKTIQLSPMQPQKDPYNGYWGDQWWKLYQPYGFKVADNNENVLGNKNDLTAMCAKAKSLGIDVIVDVVTNHLAGGSASSLNGNISNFEPEIKNNNLIHNLGRYADNDDLESIVRGNIGDYPDLMTETTTVQNRVISMLKEYIDCGVNGFRFDAAKHIETPDDGNYASNYWPNVLGAAESYATSKGLDKPYSYGEILGPVGTGRSYSSYTEYLSVVDNRQGSTVLKAVQDKDVSKTYSSYTTNTPANTLVLWAESHDTYANDSKETTNISNEIINKTYMIQTSRKDVATLYFARPGNDNMGSIGNADFKNDEIRAINTFHNLFVGQSEKTSDSQGCFVNVRGNQGAAIIGVNNNSNNLTVSVPNLKEGTYVDLITNKEYQVSNNSVTVNLTKDACVLVDKDMETPTEPSLSIGSYKEVFSGTQTIQVNATNATKVTYSVDNGSQINISNNQIVLGNDISNGKHNLKITASNKYGSVKENIVLVKSSSFENKSIVIYDVDNSYTYLCWAWGGNDGNKWLSFDVDNNVIATDLNGNNNFIVVKFDKDTTKDNANWNNARGQTVDMSYSKQLYGFQELVWK